MTISAAQLQFFLSGGPDNTNPNISIGGAISSTPVLGVLNNLFPDISSGDASSGRTDYRCVYVKNTNPSDSLYEASVYLYSQTSGGSDVSIGTSALPVGTTAPLLAVDTLSPAGVNFQETNTDNRIELGTIGPLTSVPVWIRRATPSNTSSKDRDAFILKIVGKPFV